MWIALERRAVATTASAFEHKGLTVGERVCAQQRIMPAALFIQAADHFLAAVGMDFGLPLNCGMLAPCNPWAAFQCARCLHTELSFGQVAHLEYRTQTTAVFARTCAVSAQFEGFVGDREQQLSGLRGHVHAVPERIFGHVHAIAVGRRTPATGRQIGEHIGRPVRRHDGRHEPVTVRARRSGGFLGTCLRNCLPDRAGDFGGSQRGATDGWRRPFGIEPGTFWNDELDRIKHALILWRMRREEELQGIQGC